MTQQSLFKKSVATLIGFLLIISLMLCFAPNNDANADEIIWEQIDYEKHFNKEITDAGNLYGGTIKELTYIKKYRYLYVFIVGSGGMGGESENNVGYGGGAGGFAAVKIDLKVAQNLIIVLGKGGGKVEFNEGDSQQTGDGFLSTVSILNAPTETMPISMDVIVIGGGKLSSNNLPGEGGKVDRGTPKYQLMKLLYSQSGADGGQASHSFSVDLGFRTEHFIYRPMGAYPSGKGGGASVFHRGGDGGVMFKNGSDGLMGAGGSGAGKGASQGGFGGDAYMEVYGSNM